MAIEEVGTNTLPNVYIDKIDITEGQETISLSVKLSVKDISNSVGLWKGTMVEQYAKIDLLCIVTEGDQSGSDTNQERIDLIDSINKGEVASINVDSGYKILRTTLSLSTDMMPESHTDRFGEVIYDYYYDATPFNFSKMFLSDVVLYACVYVDFSDLNNGYDFSFLKNYVGYTRSEIVYKNGSVNTTTSYFLDNNTGLVWPGAVHFHEGTGWMVGAQHVEGPHARLEKIDISNPKINLKFIEPSVVEDKPFPGIVKSISDPDYYFDLDESVGGTFTLDVRNILFNDTFEGALVYEVAPSLFDNLTSYIDIREMEIIRERVSQNFAVNPLYTAIDPDTIVYDDNDRIVAQTSNNVGTALKPSQRYVLDNKIAVNVDIDKLPQTKDNLSVLDLNNLSKDQLEEATRTGSIKEIENLQINGIRIISFTDDYIKQLKGGEYKYTVKIIINNRISDLMIELFRNLKNSIEQNKKTLLDSENGQNYDFQNDKFKQEYIAATNNLYDLNTNTISQTSLSAPWIDGVYKFSLVKQLLTTEPTDSTTMINNLAPASAKQSTLSDTIEGMERVLKEAMNRYNYSEADIFEGNFDSRKGTAGGGNRKKTFSIEKQFRNTISTDFMDRMGYKFFEDNSFGVNVISRQQMIDRGTKEFNKFFTAIPNNSDANSFNVTNEQKQELRDIRGNLFSYLTPLEIIAGTERKVIDGSDSSFDIEFSSRLQLQKKEKGRNFSRKGKRDLFRRSSARSGFKFDPPKKFKNTSTKDEVYVKASEYLSKKSKFEKLDIKSLSKTKGSSKFAEDQNINILSSISNDKNRSSGKIPSINNFKVFPKKKMVLKKTPMQIKALILSDSSSTKSNFGDYDVLADPNTRQAVVNNFTKIRQIEYLKGYSNANGLNLVSEPIWELLDKEVLDNIGNKKLFCRLKTYTNEFYDIAEDPDDIKDYNEIFIIDGEQ